MIAVQSFFANLATYFTDLYFSKNYLQAGAIIILIFLLILTLAQVRSHFIHWSIKGGLVGLLFGFILTILLEGFLLVNGNTFLTTILSWRNPPKPFSTALDLGKEKLTNILGVSTDNPSTKDAVNILQSLDPDEISKIKAIMCTQ